MIENEILYNQLVVVDRQLSEHPDDVALSIWKGLLLRQLGQDAEAISLYEQVLARHPNLVDAYLGLSQAFLHVGRPSDAFTTIQIGLSLNPQSAKNWAVLGYILEAKRQYHEASQAYTEGVHLDPTDGNIWFHLGNMLAKQENHAEAIAAYQRVITLQDEQTPDAWANMSEEYRRIEDYEHSYAAICTAYALDPITPAIQNLYANALAAHGHYHEARTLYEALLQQDPLNALYLNNMGALLNDLSNWELAISFLEQAQSLTPSSDESQQENQANIWFNLTRSYYATGRYTQSLKNCLLALHAMPHLPMLWVLKHHILVKLGDTKGAQHAMKRAYALDPQAHTLVAENDLAENTPQ